MLTFASEPTEASKSQKNDSKFSTKTKTFQNLNKNCPLDQQEFCRIGHISNLYFFVHPIMHTWHNSTSRLNHHDILQLSVSLFYLSSNNLDPVFLCTDQSHHREVPGWEIFMEQELRFGLDLDQLALLKKKKTFGLIMSNF